MAKIESGFMVDMDQIDYADALLNRKEKIEGASRRKDRCEAGQGGRTKQKLGTELTPEESAALLWLLKGLPK